MIAATAINPMGQSEVRELKFKTDRLSYGEIVRIPILSLITEKEILTALSQTIRISMDLL